MKNSNIAIKKQLAGRRTNVGNDDSFRLYDSLDGSFGFSLKNNVSYFSFESTRTEI
jgi:hypothetical protein